MNSADVFPFHSPESQHTFAWNRTPEPSDVPKNPSERTKEPTVPTLGYHANDANYPNDGPAIDIAAIESKLLEDVTVDAAPRMNGDVGADHLVRRWPLPVLDVLPTMDDRMSPRLP